MDLNKAVNTIRKSINWNQLYGTPNKSVDRYDSHTVPLYFRCHEPFQQTGNDIYWKVCVSRPNFSRTAGYGTDPESALEDLALSLGKRIYLDPINRQRLHLLWDCIPPLDIKRDPEFRLNTIRCEISKDSKGNNVWHLELTSENEAKANEVGSTPSTILEEAIHSLLLEEGRHNFLTKDKLNKGLVHLKQYVMLELSTTQKGNLQLLTLFDKIHVPSHKEEIEL
jgi:hypothetical protein